MSITKPWSHDSPFLLGPDAVQLYQRMMTAPWSKHDDENKAAIYYGQSYVVVRRDSRREIPTIPDFLKILGEKVALRAEMPANYIQCHRMGPDAMVRPHRDPSGMVVPMLTLGHERTFRVGGDYDDSTPKVRRPVECHRPAEEYLMRHGDLLVFNGGRTAHSMFPADKDEQCNLNGFDCRISILFRWTTSVMRAMGPDRRDWSDEQIKQHEDEYRAVQEKWIREHQAQGVLF